MAHHSQPIPVAKFTLSRQVKLPEEPRFVSDVVPCATSCSPPPSLLSLFLFCSRVMSSKQTTSPFASVVDGDNAMSQENLPWEKEESAEAHGTPQLPLHSLLHGKAHPDELQPLSSVPPESDWDSLVSAQQRMVRPLTTLPTALSSLPCFHYNTRKLPPGKGWNVAGM